MIFIKQHKTIDIRIRKGVMVFNATFNNISVISWPLVLLVEETGVPGENLELGQLVLIIDQILINTHL
jgi:hypothetical protein